MQTATMTLDVVTLTNGLKGANFSSAHDFLFEDGTRLKALSLEESERLKVIFIEELSPGPRGETLVNLQFKLSAAVEEKMKVCAKAFKDQLVDIVLCPLPMMQAIHQMGSTTGSGPFRSIRRNGCNTNEISIDKFCI